MLHRLALCAVLLAAVGTTAHAQYYPPGPAYPPPGGYPPPPVAGSDGYPPPQPEGELPPRVEGYGYGPPGSRCNGFFTTPYGDARQRVCPMGVAKPVGAPCSCPPRGPYGPVAHGRVIP